MQTALVFSRRSSGGGTGDDAFYDLGLRVGAEPVHRLRVPELGPLGTPRLVERDLVHHLLEVLPHFADLDDGPVGERVVQEPSADAVAGLEDEDRNIIRLQVARGAQSSKASSYHYDVDSFGDVCPFHPLPFSSSLSRQIRRSAVRDPHYHRG